MLRKSPSLMTGFFVWTTHYLLIAFLLKLNFLSYLEIQSTDYAVMHP
jgi:hypothetical protein